MGKLALVATLSLIITVVLVLLVFSLFSKPTTITYQAPLPTTNSQPVFFPLLTISSSTTIIATSSNPVVQDLPKNKLITKNQPPDTAGPAAYDLALLTRELHRLTNEYRQQNNLSRLSFDNRLATIAKKRSIEMVEQNYFSHTSPSDCSLTCLLEDVSYQTNHWGENLGEYTSYEILTETEVAGNLIQLWIESASHRANMLNSKYTKQGIGIARSQDRIIVTVVFAQ